MLAKRSSRALALLLVLPSAAFALGLGDIRLLSPLNAPLDAEIELVDVAPDEVNTVQAQIASRETFARYGLEWPAYLSRCAGAHRPHSRRPSGHQAQVLRSDLRALRHAAGQVNWSRGQLVREYTMLLDPPVYTPGKLCRRQRPGERAGERRGDPRGCDRARCPGRLRRRRAGARACCCRPGHGARRGRARTAARAGRRRSRSGCLRASPRRCRGSSE